MATTAEPTQPPTAPSHGLVHPDGARIPSGEIPDPCSPAYRCVRLPTPTRLSSIPLPQLSSVEGGPSLPKPSATDILISVPRSSAATDRLSPPANGTVVNAGVTARVITSARPAIT